VRNWLSRAELSHPLIPAERDRNRMAAPGLEQPMRGWRADHYTFSSCENGSEVLPLPWIAHAVNRMSLAEAMTLDASGNLRVAGQTTPDFGTAKTSQFAQRFGALNITTNVP